MVHIPRFKPQVVSQFRQEPKDPFVHLVCEIAGKSNAFETIEPLSDLGYDQELAIKQKAFTCFLAQNRITTKPLEIIPSPLFRHYRTTSKRRIVFAHKKWVFAFAEGNTPPQNESVAVSLLEPKEHALIYQQLHEMLITPPYRGFLEVLNFIIIRGTYTERCVIFNVRRLDAGIVRALKKCAQALATMSVASCFAFVDERGSAYYLDESVGSDKMVVKKLFGYDSLRLVLNGVMLHYSPFAFCQINHAILPEFINQIQGCLSDAKREFMLDLYCGFGLFSFTVGKSFSSVVAIDANARALSTCTANAVRLGREKAVKCVEGFIAPQVLSGIASRFPVRTSEVLLLDPPRSGVHRGVIESCAGRKPTHVVHIFCGTPTITDACTSWNKQGYELTKIVPCDLFPGTAHIETIGLFQRV